MFVKETYDSRLRKEVKNISFREINMKTKIY